MTILRSPWLTCLLALLLLSTLGSGRQCEEGWSEGSFGVCLKLVKSLATQSTAFELCDSVGGHLVDVKTKEDQLAVNQLVFHELYNFHWLWIGLEYSTGGWRWSDGSPLGFSSWAAFQPSLASQRPCARLLGGRWATAACDQVAAGAVCQKEAAQQCQAECGWDWWTTRRGTACVKPFHASYGISYSDARKACQELGAHYDLATIASQEEQDIVRDAVLTDYFGLQTSWLWMGLERVSATSSDWRWIDGTKFEFGNWYSGGGLVEPNNETLGAGQAGQDCAVSLGGGAWNDVQCDGHYGDAQLAEVLAQGYLCMSRCQPLSTPSPPPTLAPTSRSTAAPTTAGQCGGRCPSDWLVYRGGRACGRALRGALPQHTAQETCAQFGARLMTIRDGEDQTALQEILRREGPNFMESWYWIGLERKGKEWRWSDGSPLGFTDWYPGKPEGERCVEAYGDEGSRWNDFACDGRDGDRVGWAPEGYVCAIECPDGTSTPSITTIVSTETSTAVETSTYSARTKPTTSAAKSTVAESTYLTEPSTFYPSTTTATSLASSQPSPTEPSPSSSLSLPTSPAIHKCPIGWWSVGSSARCGKVFNCSVPQTEARRRCAQLGPSASLVTIASMDEQIAVSHAVKEELGEEAWAWIGLSRARSGGWEWEDGTAFGFSHWLPGQPDNATSHTGQRCVELKSSNGWNDYDCGGQRKGDTTGENTAGFVCQIHRTT